MMWGGKGRKGRKGGRKGRTEGEKGRGGGGKAIKGRGEKDRGERGRKRGEERGAVLEGCFYSAQYFHKLPSKYFFERLSLCIFVPS